MDQYGATPIEHPLVVHGASVRREKTVRDLRGLPAVLARSGSLELRLATTKREIRKAQRLRYAVFYEEGDALPNAFNALLRRDKCPYDRVCDHLQVVDTAFVGRAGIVHSKVVGTYRLLRSDVATAEGGFYSENEFELGPLLERHAGQRFLELGRSCVHGRYRSKRVIDLLWKGIGLYAAHHGSTVLIGCSSLPGTTPATLAAPLSFAYHFAASAPDWQVAAVAGRATPMNWLARHTIDPRQSMARLPALMKAYVRAGGTFASEAVVDHAFGTVDLFTVLPFAAANARYMAHFSSTQAPWPASRLMA